MYQLDGIPGQPYPADTFGQTVGVFSGGPSVAVHEPAVCAADDATGLTGKYDVTLKFVAAAIPLPGTPVERGPNGEIIPPVVNSRPTLTEAVQSQLGLKLESKKATANLMVVDRVEKVPVEN
jgi:uncharacterized protein (TIGR03435 family)